MLRRSLFFLLIAGAPNAIGEVSAPQPERIEITRAAASNWQDKEYHFTKAFDGNIHSSWGTGGSFIMNNKEWITLYLERPIFVTKIRIAPGLQANPQSLSQVTPIQIYRDNGRPQNLSVSFSDGSQQSINLIDFEDDEEMGFQDRNIKPIRTRWVRLQINSIYRGGPNTQTQDVGIAEVEVYGYDSLPDDDN